MFGWLVGWLVCWGWLVGWLVFLSLSRTFFSWRDVTIGDQKSLQFRHAQHFRFLLQCRMSRKNTRCLSFSCSWIIYSFWTNGVCILFITSHVLSIPPVPSKECFELPKTQLQVTFAVFNLLIEIYFTKEDWCFNFL